MKFHSSAPAALLLLSFAPMASADLVLGKNIMDLTLESAKLSVVVYDTTVDDTGYASLQVFNHEPDQALVARTTNGYCFGVFRGTTKTISDWSQNFDPRKMPICESDSPEECCETRKGFYDAYFAEYWSEFEKALGDCASQCENADECVVLSGHSQGASIAGVAGERWANANPYIISFGQPRTIENPCEGISSERYYRWVNSRVDDDDIVYDPVTQLPGLGTEHLGHGIILGEGTNLAYIGIDNNEGFSPLDLSGVAHHKTIYLDKISAIISATTEYPISAVGFPSMEFCSKDIECASRVCGDETHDSLKRCYATECSTDDDCAATTGRCDGGLCLPKLPSCSICDEDADCNSGKCFIGKCANKDFKMDNECPCGGDGDCASGRCEGYIWKICEAQLPKGARCNEDSDCISDNCSWRFKCNNAGEDDFNPFEAQNYIRGESIKAVE
mmetsp:Transcript_12056/g.16091  ORF Transcript_12056/g.16091 Transcript_12056/m.16091 type:complete len:446 (-) Transcript_12056:71-1408(-)